MPSYLHVIHTRISYEMDAKSQLRCIYPYLHRSLLGYKNM
jgi:hypothetical protein